MVLSSPRIVQQTSDLTRIALLMWTGKNAKFSGLWFPELLEFC